MEENNKFTQFDEMRVREDELFYDPKEEDEKHKKYGEHKRSTKTDTMHYSNGGPDMKSFNESVSGNFKKWFMDQINVLKSEKLVKQPSTRKRNSLINADKQQDDQCNIKQDPSDISFVIMILLRGFISKLLSTSPFE